jgi:iron(III) transport system permease protein
VPLVVPTYVGGFAYVAAFGPRGMLQSLLAPLGVERLPEIYGLPGAALALTLFSYPYVLLTVRGALLGMDPALEDASRSLGTRPLPTFLRVTLPQLRPAIGAGALLVALYALSDFGAVSLLRFSSFTRVIYLQYQGAFDRTPAAVLALLLVVFTIALLVVEARVRGRARLHRGSAGAKRQLRPVALGRWRWPAVAFCALVVFLALVVPITVLGYWLVRGVSAGEPLRLVWGAAWNSVRISGVAALVAASSASATGAGRPRCSSAPPTSATPSPGSSSRSPSSSSAPATADRSTRPRRCSSSPTSSCSSRRPSVRSARRSSRCRRRSRRPHAASGGAGWASSSA